MTCEPLRVISYGGGVQSTSLLIMAALRNPEFEKIMGGQVTTALFANVGDDSEHPLALSYIRDTVKPWAAERGVEVVELQWTRRNGEKETLWKYLTNKDIKSIPIPVRMESGAPGNRLCTRRFKLDVIGKWLKKNGASPSCPANVAIGFSTDEFERANRKTALPYENPIFPLLEMNLSRAGCQQINVANLGKPAPKSACFFCPFRTILNWSEMRRDEPELFEQAALLEKNLNEQRESMGQDKVWLTRFHRPIEEAISEAQTPLFGETEGPEGCDSGGCWL